jgi:hypothetical protein
MKTRHFLLSPAGDGTDLGGSAVPVVDDPFGNEFIPTDTDLETDDDPQPAKTGADAGADPDLDLEGEETDEERIEREAEEARVAREARIRIPKARFDEAVSRERARAEEAEARLAAFEAAQRRQPAPAQTDAVAAATQQLDTLQDRYEELLVDGEREEAREVRKQINQLQEYVQSERANQLAETARARTLGTLKYESTLASIEQQYPALNPDRADDYDQNMADEVAGLMRSLMLSGVEQVQALQRAVKYVAGAPQQPAKQPANAPAGREEQARRKAAAAASAQPQPTDLRGKTAAPPAPPSLKRMTFEQFKNIPEADLAKMRGDEL